MAPETERTRPKERKGTPTLGEIRSEFIDRDLPRHLALFYDDVETQLTVSAAFAKHELGRGRQFLYLYEDNDVAAVRRAFEMADIDVEERRAAGALRIEDATEVYLKEEFDPQAMIGALEDATTEAVDAGYTGLSVAGENTWCFHTSFSFDHVLEFESDFDACAPDLPVTALCQYSLDRFDQESISKALWTHEQIVYRGRICENPFYVPPEEFRRSETSKLEARLMLEQTYNLSQARRDVVQREQRIGVLNRTLRHNIRNELNIVLGHLADVGRDEGLPEKYRERLETASQYAEKIVRTSEKARYVEQTLSEGRLGPIDLERAVIESVERTRSLVPGAEITTALGASPTVLADENFGEALDELLENAVQHQERSPPVANVSLDVHEQTVVLEVRNPGDPIPADDQRALRTGQETSLNHAQGIGLWMVKWIVENSHGRLTFPTHPGESRVRIELPATSVLAGSGAAASEFRVTDSDEP
ncbi:MEDS domain-containing protein [Halobellus rarus]|uniref:MEDS domain-containing protein n=1 Tax=Halobellus rarus TaxID=1126237 RepID=A0ABD6CJH9_9EURY|nr:MEDS domain-containing protein [Halobellus rarus]